MDQLPENIALIIKQLPSDLRAEIVLADLIEKGLDREVMLVSAKGVFKRRFSNDLERVSNLNIDRKSKFVVAEINREGIYDALPQAVTHTVKRSRKGIKGSAELIQQLKETRREEAAARSFFLPFENEFYQQRVELEIAERSILNGFLSNSRYTALLNEFWQLPQILTERQKATFIYLLPIVYKAAGNPGLTKKCYEAILNVPVNLQIKSGPGQCETTPPMPEDEPVKLGTNFVCGDKYYGYNTWYEIMLGPLNETQLQDYLPGKNGSAIIDYLNSYYLPFDAAVKLSVCTQVGINEFVLNKNGNRLAYTTCL